MIGRALRKAVRLLASARLATLLLALAGGWSVVASVVPQGGSTDERVTAWAAANPVAESIVGVLGLHNAFAAPVFALLASVLALSTALCAWQRTKVAIAKSRGLRSAASFDGQSQTPGHDLKIACDPGLEPAEILVLASDAFRDAGIRTKRRGDVLTAVSPSWSVWGSPVFHWALLALMFTMVLGTLLRSSGQIGLAVGESKVDAPESYGILSDGLLYTREPGARTIRVDAFDVNFKSGGVNRGPTPTVTILDAQGAVIKTQLVYPNNTLQIDSLTIYPADYGLSAAVSLLDPEGQVYAHGVQLIDFSGDNAEGTKPVSFVSAPAASGNPAMKVTVTVPLDSVAEGLVARLPKDVRAHVVVTSSSGEPLLDQTMRPGEEVALPVAGMLRLDDVGYYARLQLVDDPTVPLLYAVLAIATIGLSVAALAPQHIVLASVIRTPEGTALGVRLRLWRNVTTNRAEIEKGLARALGGPDAKETT